MAGEYVQLHASWLSNRKFKRFARYLNISPFIARAHAAHLWVNCIVQAPDGSLEDFEAFEIAELAQWEGDPEEFLGALTKSGLIDWTESEIQGEKPWARLHDWEQYSGSIKKADMRRKERERKRRQRSGERGAFVPAQDAAEVSHGHPQLVPGTVRESPALTNERTERIERRELNNNEQTNSETGTGERVVVVVDSLDSEKLTAPEFETFAGDRLARKQMSSGQMAKARTLEPFTKSEIDRAFATAQQQDRDRQRFQLRLLALHHRCRSKKRRASVFQAPVRSGPDTALLKIKWRDIAPEGWRGTLDGNTARELEQLTPSPEALAEACRGAEESGTDVWSEALMRLRAARGPLRDERT